MGRELTVTEAELMAVCVDSNDRAQVNNLLDRIITERRSVAQERAASQRAFTQAAVEFYKKAMREGKKA